MTGTVVDSLSDATAALNAATAAINALEGSIAAKANASQVAASTVINNFLARPIVGTMFLDEINGSDSNDASTPALAKKTMASVLVAAAGNATKIVMLSDVHITAKLAAACASLFLIGQQVVSNGTIAAQRTIYFQGTATNSPDLADNWTFGSGLFLGCATLSTNYVNFSLADLPGGQTFTAALTSQQGIECTFLNGTVLVGSQNAGQLFQAVNAKGIVYSNLALGAGAAGHLFTGVAAGANPNALWQYDTNVTSG